MTIAELQLSRMRPLLVDPNSLDVLRAAKRRRRVNFALLVIVWTGMWIYGLSQMFATDDLGAALDRFLPVQVVAALAAVAIIAGNRRYRLGRHLRRMSRIPAMATLGGAVGVIFMLMAHGGAPEDVPLRVPDVGPRLEIRTISL